MVDINIGEILKNKRISLGLTFAQVRQKTKISHRYLRAIEENNFTEFPAELYLKGTLYRYAEFLGLNPDEINTFYLTSKVKDKSKVEGKPVKVPSSVTFFNLEKKIVWLICILILFFILLLRYLDWVSFNINQEPTPVTVKPVTPFKEIASVPPKVRKHRLEIRAIIDTWIKVVSDEQLVFEGLVSAGKEHLWEARRNFQIRVGYARGIEVKFNGKPIDLIPYARQEVAEVDLPAILKDINSIRKSTASVTERIMSSDKNQPLNSAVNDSPDVE